MISAAVFWASHYPPLVAQSGHDLVGVEGPFLFQSSHFSIRMIWPRRLLPAAILFRLQ